MKGERTLHGVDEDCTALGLQEGDWTDEHVRCYDVILQAPVLQPHKMHLIIHVPVTACLSLSWSHVTPVLSYIKALSLDGTGTEAMDLT